MPCPGEGPCSPWDLDLSCCLTVSGSFPDPCILDGQPIDQDVIDSAILAASQFMWRKTGMQFGCCQVTLRPLCPNRCSSPCPGLTDSGFGFPWTPVHLASGDWTNVTCPSQNNCTCVEICEIPLPYPVCSVDEVKVDGVVLSPTTYSVINFNKLIRKAGVEALVGPEDWVANTVETPGLSISYTNPSAGNILVGGNVNINFNPFIGYDLPVFTGPGLLYTMGAQSITQPIDLNLCFLFDNTGDTITVNPAAVDRVVGPATYDSNTGLITYTGTFPNAADPALFEAQVVCVYFRQGFQASAITFPQPVTLWRLQWSNDEVAGTCWPECNNLTLPDSEEGTWSVKVTYGRPVPELVRKAAAVLACEFIKFCVGKPCTIPQRVTSISRQGMSATFLDPMEFMSEGKTGIYLVDLAIMTYNPKGLYKKPGVYSPDSLNKWAVETWRSGDPLGPNCT